MSAGILAIPRISASRRISCTRRVASAVLLLGLAKAIGIAAPVEQRAFGVVDAISRSQLIEPAFRRDPMPLSPDGWRCFFVTKKGLLASNMIEYSLGVLELSGEKSAGPTARILAKYATPGNQPAIDGAQWVNSSRIVFALRKQGSARSLHRLDVHTGQEDVLLEDTEDLAAYSSNQRGDLIYALQRKSLEPEQIAEQRAAGVVAMPEQQLNELATGRWASGTWSSPYELWFKSNGDNNGRLLAGGIKALLGMDFARRNLQLSPDGSKVIVVQDAEEYPDLWRDYRDTTGRLSKLVESKSRLRTVAMFDTLTGEKHLIGNMPLGIQDPHFQAAWIGTNTIILAGVMWPLDRLAELEEQDKADAFIYQAVVEVDLIKKSWRLICFRKENTRFINSIRWHATRQVLEILQSHLLKPDVSLEFTKREQGWLASPVDAARPVANVGHTPDGNLEIFREESIATPPSIVIRNRRTGQATRIVDLNPQYVGLALGKTVELSAQDEEGRKWSFGVVFPPDFQEGIRYPAVIQTHGFDRDEYLIDGPFALSTGYAAQALASAGFIVIQGAGPLPDAYSWYVSEREGPVALLGLKAMLNEVTKRGWVDSARVALQGFSRTSYWVKYALTRSNMNIRAAAVADGVDFSYMQFMDAGLNSAGQPNNEYKGVYSGELPYGQGLVKWLELAPGFNLHRVNAPVRIEAIGSGSVIWEWEFYSGLRHNRVPAEFVFYPDGEHELKKPREIFRSQQGNVDWFRFWLKREERTEPVSEAGETRESLAEQYARWHKLREIHETELKKPRPPRLKWTATPVDEPTSPLTSGNKP